MGKGTEDVDNIFTSRYIFLTKEAKLSKLGIFFLNFAELIFAVQKFSNFAEFIFAVQQ